MHRDLFLELLSVVLIGIILWSGVVTGGGIIEKPLINTTISIIASLLTMDFITGFLMLIMLSFGFLVVEIIFKKDSFLWAILHILSVLGSLIFAIYLSMTWLGKWLGFFPIYPTNTRWFITIALAIITLVVALVEFLNKPLT